MKVWYFYALFFGVLILSSRLAGIYKIVPGNAPDEPGHFRVINNLAHGKFMSVEREMKLKGYPYSLYNPLPYLPSIISLHIANLVNPNILNLSIPLPDSLEAYSVEKVRIIRFGQFFWTILFFIFFAKFLYLFLKYIFPLYNLLQIQKIFFLVYLSVISIPQLLFIQCYSNMDAMGVFAVFYHLWSMFALSPVHFGISLFFVFCSKLNVYCVFAFSFVFFIYLRFKNCGYRMWVISTIVSMIFSTWWCFVLPFIHEMGIKSILGFFLLPSLYDVTPIEITRSLLNDFIFYSIISSYGLFGWMTSPMPTTYYNYYYFIISVAPIFYLIRFLFIRPNSRILFFSVGFGLLVGANLILHFISGFGHSFQPQGRYLIFSVLLFYVYFYSTLGSLAIKNDYLYLISLIFLLSMHFKTIDTAIGAF